MKRKPEYFGSGCNYIFQGSIKKRGTGGRTVTSHQKVLKFSEWKEFSKEVFKYIDLFFGGSLKYVFPWCNLGLSLH